MSRTLSALLFALATALAAPSPSKAAAAQPLMVNVGERSSQVRNLSSYDALTPVTVRVVAPRARGAEVRAVDPSGRNVRLSLTRGADGAWTGPLVLGTTGTWTVTVETTGPNGHVTGTPPFPVTAAGAPAQTSPGLLIALACLSICGGVGLIGVGRRSEARAAA